MSRKSTSVSNSVTNSSTECLWDLLTQFGASGVNTSTITLNRDLLVSSRVKDYQQSAQSSSKSSTTHAEKLLSWSQCQALISPKVKGLFRECNEIESRFSELTSVLSKHMMMDTTSDLTIIPNSMYLSAKLFYDDSKHLFKREHFELPSHMTILRKGVKLTASVIEKKESSEGSQSKNGPGESSGVVSSESGTSIDDENAESTDPSLQSNGGSGRTASLTEALEKTYVFAYDEYDSAEEDRDEAGSGTDPPIPSVDSRDTGVLGGTDGRKTDMDRKMKRKERLRLERLAKRDMRDCHLKSRLEKEILFLSSALDFDTWVRFRDNMYFVLRRVECEKIFGYKRLSKQTSDGKSEPSAGESSRLWMSGVYGYDGSIIYRNTPSAKSLMLTNKLFGLEYVVPPVKLKSTSKFMAEEDEMLRRQQRGESVEGKAEEKRDSPSSSSSLTTKIVSRPPGSSKKRKGKSSKKAKTKKSDHRSDVGELSRSWLMQHVSLLVEMDPSCSKGLTTDEMCDTVLNFLHSPLPESDLQSLLMDTLGFNAFDLIATLIQKRDMVKAKTKQWFDSSNHHQSGTGGSSSSSGRSGKKGKKRTRTVVSLSSESHKQSSDRGGRETMAMQMKKQRQEFEKMKQALIAQGFTDSDASYMLKSNEHAIKRERLGADAARSLEETGKIDEEIVDELTRDKRKIHTLPTGQKFEEVVFPPTVRSQSEAISKMGHRISIAECSAMPDWAKSAFLPFGIASLNAMQSKCFEIAFHTSNNVLLCAPTGAGKTNVAILTILREMSLNMGPGNILAKAEEFKMIYVAPMKALAQEIVRKFSQRLGRLGVIVKELTGDMQLSKSEISETHIIVVTPEKWDVITRKSSENSGGTGSGGDGLVDAVKLLIIDEVHLLHDGRGSVLEALVARTLRFVEQKQNIIRIVGLSATLPNYLDVASFLRAEKGILYFGDEYRPVPLQMTFVGLGESGGSRAVKNLEDYVCFQKCCEAISVNGDGITPDAKKQCMVFLHSRKGTAITGDIIRQLAIKEGKIHLFETIDDKHSDELRHLLRKKKTTAQNRDLLQLIQYGFAFHHAGMQRHDRLFVEKLFEKGMIKILCCTATLAWGINLPASTVIIKGTELYIPDQGGFVDLGALDVFQIFGRAGRPQFIEDYGHAILITKQSKLHKYISMLTNQLPIESNFLGELANHLNAEVVLGSVTSMDEAIQWLTYTYLYVRMLKNPMRYGMTYQEIINDPHLYIRRKKILEDAALILSKNSMCRFDIGENIFPTDIGRVAAHYYIDYQTISFWNNILKKGSVFEIDKSHEQDVTHFGADSGRSIMMRNAGEINLTTDYLIWMLCNAQEFKELRVRDDELSDLRKLSMDKLCCPFRVREDHSSPVGKSIILLQCVISRRTHAIKHSTLLNDVNYITQNMGRISRGLFELSLRLGLGSLCRVMLELCKCIEYQIWPHLTPLRHFDHDIHDDLFLKIEQACSVGAGSSSYQRRRLSIDDLANNRYGHGYSVSDLGVLIRDQSNAGYVRDKAKEIPKIFLAALCKPITRSLLSIEIELTVTEFRWNEKPSIHGQNNLTYWIWVCSDEFDEQGNPTANGKHIFHYEQWQLSYKDYSECKKNRRTNIRKYRDTNNNSDDGGNIDLRSTEGETMKISVVVPIPEINPETGCRPINQYEIHISNNYWLGTHDMCCIDFEHLILPEMYPPETVLFPLHPLPVTALRNPLFESHFPFKYFNPIQTQVFHVCFNTDYNVLLGAPTGSGKTVAAELCMLRLLGKNKKSEEEGKEKGDCDEEGDTKHELLEGGGNGESMKRKRDRRMGTPLSSNSNIHGYGGGKRKVIYIAPMKALARERYRSWSKGFCAKLGLEIVMLTGDMTPDRSAIEAADIIIATPEKFDGVSRYWSSRAYVRRVGLIIFDEIHLLGLDRGPVLEVIVSRLRFVESKRFKEEFEKKKMKMEKSRNMAAKKMKDGSIDELRREEYQKLMQQEMSVPMDDPRRVRILGLSTAIANAEDLADWLGVDHRIGLYNFPAAQRPVPCTVHLQGYPGRHYCPRMQSMNKPAFQAILTHSPNKPVLIFVSSRRQTRLTAIDLISHMSRSSAMMSNDFLHCDSSEMNYITSNQVRDLNLKHTLEFGIGLHHAGLHPSDRKLVEDLFLKGVIQILVATSTLAWGVNLPAHLVIIKGTEYFDAKVSRYVQLPVTDILQMIGRAGRPQFDSSSVAVVLVHSSKKQFYRKFLYQSFPVESSLHEMIIDHLNAEISVGTLKTLTDIIEYMSYTFLFRRLIKNPSYYQLISNDVSEINLYLRDLIKSCLWDLYDSGCLEFIGDDDSDDKDGTTAESTSSSFSNLQFEPTECGKIASYYYISHKTLELFNSELRTEDGLDMHLDDGDSDGGPHSSAEMMTSLMNEILRILSNAHEFDELPVRHNEEKLNEALGKEVRWSVDDLALDEPSTKANILYQCHFGRIELPISDYVTDTQSVMDQSIRILQALLDFCVLYKSERMIYVEICIHLIQMVSQGRWIDDHTLMNVPYFNTLDIIEYWHTCYNVEGLAELLYLDWNDVHRMIQDCPLMKGYSQTMIDEIKSTLGFKLPRISLNVSFIQQHSDNEENQTITVVCRTRRYSGNPQKIFSPHWYKTKMEGWFILISLENELLSLKRLRILSKSKSQSTRIPVSLPVRRLREIAKRKGCLSFEVEITVQLMSDAYLGLDQSECVSVPIELTSMEEQTGGKDPLCDDSDTMSIMSFATHVTDQSLLIQHFGQDFDPETASKLAEINIWD